MVDPGNRSYWDKIFFENRGGSTTLPIAHMKVVMRYDNPPGTSPHVSGQTVDGLALGSINHAEIPIVDWPLGMSLLGGYDTIDLTEFRKRSLHEWVGLEASDPDVVRRTVEDIGKSGSDGSDNFGRNPKYGGRIDLLCSEFVSWYYHEDGERVNGKSLRDIVGTQQLHDLFKDEGNLYRYNSGVRKQDFVHASSGARCTPKPGDWLERRGPDSKAGHSMMMFRWVPKDPSAPRGDDRDHQALVINGPWPVTLRLVEVHEEEKRTGDGWPKDYWLGAID